MPRAASSLLLALLLCTACASNPFAEHYVLVSRSQRADLRVSGGEPEVLVAFDLESAARKLRAEGIKPVGYSQFQSWGVPLHLAAAQGASVGAEFVLVRTMLVDPKPTLKPSSKQKPGSETTPLGRFLEELRDDADMPPTALASELPTSSLAAVPWGYGTQPNAPDVRHQAYFVSYWKRGSRSETDPESGSGGTASPDA